MLRSGCGYGTNQSGSGGAPCAAPGRQCSSHVNTTALNSPSPLRRGVGVSRLEDDCHSPPPRLGILAHHRATPPASWSLRDHIGQYSSPEGGGFQSPMGTVIWRLLTVAERRFRRHTLVSTTSTEVPCTRRRRVVRYAVAAAVLLPSVLLLVGYRSFPSFSLQPIYSVSRSEMGPGPLNVALDAHARLHLGNGRQGVVARFDTAGMLSEERRVSGFHDFDLGGNGHLFILTDSSIVEFNSNGQPVASTATGFELDGGARLHRHSRGSFFVLGAAQGKISLIHRVDTAGYAGSFFEPLRNAPARYQAQQLRAQLNQGVLCEASEGDLLVALAAPYLVGRFTPSGVERWLVADSLIAAPWDGAISLAPDRYSVSVYPMISALNCLDRDVFQVIITDHENARRISDIRRVSDGSLISRSDWPYESHPTVLGTFDAQWRLGVIYHSSPGVRKYVVVRWERS